MSFQYTEPHILVEVAADYVANGYEDVLVDASGGPITIYLPSGPLAGTSVAVRKNDDSDNAVTVDGDSHTIDGHATVSLANQGDTAVYASNGTAWATAEASGMGNIDVGDVVISESQPLSTLLGGTGQNTLANVQLDAFGQPGTDVAFGDHRLTGVADGIDVNDAVNVGQLAGAPVLRAFPFAFDTPNLLTGAAVYTPSIGDLLLGAFVHVVTAWDGSTPQINLGSWPGYDPVGYFASPLDASLAQGTFRRPASDLASIISGPDWVPPRLFIANDPIDILVSSDGLGPTFGSVVASNPATVPTTVVTGTNDEFAFNSVTYTVAPGTYTTIAALAAAMSAAVDGSSNPLSTVLAISSQSSTTLEGFTTIPTDALNGVAFAAGAHDFLAASGFTGANAVGNGKIDGGDPASTHGSAVLYLLTATPR